MAKNKGDLYVFLILLLTVGLSGCGKNSPKASLFELQNEKQIKIVAFGDSITAAVIGLYPEQRWTHLLEAKLNENSLRAEYRVINAGIGGNTSREGLARITRDVISQNPNVVLVEFGGNDVVADKAREVSLEEYSSNLNAMYEKLTAINAEMILLTFPPVVNTWHINGKKAKYVNSGGLDEYVELYRETTRKFAKEKGLRLIDVDRALRKACEDASVEKIILSDGVHLTAKANQIVAETIYNYMK